MSKIFISYCHRDGEFVWGRLVPTLKAAGVDVLIDVERFKLGVGCEQQMDAAQDDADIQLLCFSSEYLKSDACDHEWRRAVASDPNFRSGTILPLKVDDHVKLPGEVGTSNPLYAELHHLGKAEPWRLLMRSLNLHPDWCPLSWQNSVEEVAQSMNRMKSVNLVVDDGVESGTLLENLQSRRMPATLLPKLKRVSLADLRCATCEGFLSMILQQLQIRHTLPKQKLRAVVEFGRLMDGVDEAFLAFERFDMAAVPQRQKEYGHDLFAGFFDLTQKRKLSLLVVSQQPYATLLPPDHPVSAIPFETVELKRMP